MKFKNKNLARVLIHPPDGMEMAGSLTLQYCLAAIPGLMKIYFNAG